MSRILNVVRLQLINRQTFVGTPLLIFGGAFLLSLLVFALIPYSGVKYSGGAAAAPLWYFGIVGGQALAHTFPFALTLSATRREFHLGTFITAVLASAILASLYCLVALLESATGGWGMNGYFAFTDLGAGQLGTAFITYFAATMLLFSIGYLGTAVVKRFGALVLIVSIIALVALVTTALTLVARAGSLAGVGAWLVGMGFAGGSALVLLLVVVVSLGSYALVRRMTP